MREADSLPYGRKGKPRAVGADIICPARAPTCHPRLPLPATPCQWQRLREADSLPYGRKDNLCAVGADIICPPRAPAYHPVCLFRQHCADGDLFRTPREGRPYVLFIHSSSVPPPPLRGTSPERGRFIYGSIRESTLPQLFISEAASLFNIHLFPHIIPVASSGNTVSHIHRSKKPPLPKGGKGGFRKFSLCAPLA